ncbi:MAG: DUF2283 domain-containing protein [Alicyclobacillaceae bacterium]|nr:DUF2283 domain-containing protein [Alicyclobacillaceae bacterium]
MIRVHIREDQVRYDADHDVLHVYFPPLDLADDEEDFPGIIIRRSVHDDRIIGLVIMDYSKRDKKFLEAVLPRYDFSDIRINRAH